MRFFGLIFALFILSATTFSQAVWRQVQSPADDTWHNAFFVSEKKGWAISHQTGLILQTIDGGKSWRIQARVQSGYLETIYFIDDKNGWIAGENGRLFTTSDGGANWKKIDSFRHSDALSAVHFYDKNRGFVFGENTETRQGVIFETGDGGASWLNRSAEITDKSALSDAIFRFDKNSFVVAGRHFLRGAKGAKDFTFSEINQSGTIRGLFFVNAENGWAVGHRGLVLQTTNGGKSWEKRASFTDSILRSVVFIDEKTGFIAGNRDKNSVSLWRTNDGGATWQAVTTDFPNLHRIVSTRKKLWLFGANGAIFTASRKRI